MLSNTWWRLQVGFQSKSSIKVYTGTKETTESEKDIFYEAVDWILEACSIYDIEIMGYIASRSLHKSTTENGLWIIQSAMPQEL